MKKCLLFKIFFLLSIFSITLAQDPNNSIIKKAPEVLIQQQLQAPKINLVADHNPVQIGEQVKFTLLPENIVINSPFIYTINFGDGTSVVKEKDKSYFLHEYHYANSFTVSISITIPSGAEIFIPMPIMVNTITMQVKDVSLIVEPPVVEVGQTVFLETRFNSINTNIKYNFNFGDESSSGWIKDNHTTHTYSEPRKYSAYVEINGLDGNSLYPIAKSETKEITVMIPFSVQLTCDNNTPKLGDEITFTASSNRQEPGLEYWFNFGDDTPIQKSLRPVITKIYLEPKDYKVSVQLAPHGKPLKVSSVIPIKVLPITVELIAGNNNVLVGDIITFSALTNSTNQDFKYFFNFGDNDKVTVSNISSINHSYGEPGNFTASVRLVINNKPLTEPATLDVTISPKIIVTLRADKPNAIEGEQIKFRAIASSADNGFLYEFNFRDNTPSQTINTSTISHTFLHKGNYKVLVKLIKNERILSEAELSINISSKQYIVALKVDKPDSHIGDTLTFTASSNYYDTGLKYLFDFGDNSPVQSTQDSIVHHVYNNQRNFTASVQLLLNNIRQSEDSVVVRINLLPPPDSVRLLVEPETGETGNEFILTAIVNHQKDGLEYWFYTGDKNQSIRTLQDTIHYVYSDSGKYIAFVKLMFDGRETAISSNVEISVISNEFPWWLLVAALIIVGIGFLVKKFVKGKPKKENNIPEVKPTFHPYPDKGFSNIKELKKFNINYEIHFDPNLANMNNLLKSKEENLIKSKKVKP